MKQLSKLLGAVVLAARSSAPAVMATFKRSTCSVRRRERDTGRSLKRQASIVLALLALTWLASAAAQGQPAFRGASSAAASGAPGFRSASTMAGAPGVKFRAALSGATDTASLSINLPAGTVADDVLIAAIGVRPASATVAAPAGWTLVRRIDNNASNPNSLAVFRKVAGSSEPASYTWNVTGATNAAGGIQAFFNVDTANPIDVEAGQATPESFSHPTPSVTTTVANAMVVSAHTFATSSSWSPPSGMTEAFETENPPTPSGAGQSTEGNYVLQPAAGATGVKTATGEVSIDYGATHILALRPAAKTLTMDRPAGTVQNDVLIAAIGVRPSSAPITAPAGWTLVRRIDNNVDNTNSLAVFRKVAGASEPASYDWGVTGAENVAGGIQAFFNVDTANPIDVEAGQATNESLSHPTPSVTTTVANTMVVTAHTFATSSSWTPPDGMTEGFESQYQPVASGSGQSTEGNYVLQGSADPTGVKTATGAISMDYGATHILALRPGAVATTLSIARPAGTAANDVMIAAVGVRPATATISAPAGWTLVRRVDNNVSNPNSLAIYRKAAGSSEPASYSWQLSGVGVIAAGGIQTFSNVDTANPIDVEAGQATPESLSHATPSITTTVANAILVSAHTFATSSSWTPPTGMTEAFESQYQPVPAGSGQSTEGNYLLQAAAGATGEKSATGAISIDFGATHILALRPGGAAKSLYFIHVDHLNTPRLVADATGTTVWKWEQAEPFGVNVPDENPSGLGAFEFPLRFPGQHADKETNLAYNHFRDYDPNLGRYIENDPLGLEAGLNIYAYVGENPLSYKDPLGLQKSTVVLGPIPNAMSIFWQNYQNMKVANTIGADKYFHCMANCQAARQGVAGYAMAVLISDTREFSDTIANAIRNRPNDSAADQLANYIGRCTASQSPGTSCESICDAFRPRGLDPRL